MNRSQALGLGIGAVGAILVPRRALANCSGLQVVKFSDGVALEDGCGNVLERIQISSSGVIVSGGGYRWGFRANVVPGFQYSPVPGVSVTLSNTGYATYTTPKGSGSSFLPQTNNSPITSVNTQLGQSITGYTPKTWPGGVACYKEPCPQTVECAIAWINFMAAVLTLAAALATFLDGPILWGPDMFFLIAAATSCSSAMAELQLMCANG